MATIDELKRQGRLSNQEMDDVIERAARLQERARRGDDGRSVEDVKEVGKELDIEPRFVDAALDDLRAERARAEESARRVGIRRKKALVGAAVAALLTLLLAWGGSGGVRSAQARAEAANSALSVVLDRQAALVPQLLAMGGGAVSELETQRKRLLEARSPSDRAAAADELQVAMASVLAKLPPARDASESQMRLSLYHELVGAQNRITVEKRRYEEALAAWRAAGRGMTARLAIGMGFAERAPAPR
jgi:LemA protein